MLYTCRAAAFANVRGSGGVSRSYCLDVKNSVFKYIQEAVCWMSKIAPVFKIVYETSLAEGYKSANFKIFELTRAENLVF